MKKPTTNFRELDAAQLIQFAEEIVTKMGQHDDIFVTPTPALATLSAITQTYRESAAEAAFNDRRAISFRNEQRKELEYVISELAKYVDTVARGNETTILSAGFIPSKDRVLDNSWNPKADHLQVFPVGLGTSRIKIRVAPWKKARYYQYEYRKKGVDEPWSRLLSTKSIAIVENMEPFQEYEFRATYLGKDINPNYSDIVSTYAL